MLARILLIFFVGIVTQSCNMSAEITDAPGSTSPTPTDPRRLNKSLGADFVSGSTSNYTESVIRGYKVQATAGVIFGEPETTSTLRGYKVKASVNADAASF